jgi:ketosteroid isomerase-like protein
VTTKIPEGRGIMKKSLFSQWFVALSFAALVCWASVSIGEAAAMGKGSKAPVPSKDLAAIEAVKQLEKDMGDAMVAVDIDKLNQIFADDWATVGGSGKVVTKEKILDDIRSGRDKLVAYALGPMDVQVFGDVAVAHGGVTEKRILDGKDVSGQSLWEDILRKRAGKWVVVRTAGASVPNAQSQDPGAVAAIKKFEQDLGDAMVAVDMDKINQAYGDDWATVRSSGEIFTKQGLLSDHKSGNHKIVWFELGPMDVQVLGDVAVAQAGVREKRIQNGKDTSGQFVFMDLLKKREGKWVIVRTAGASVK